MSSSHFVRSVCGKRSYGGSGALVVLPRASQNAKPGWVVHCPQRAPCELNKRMAQTLAWWHSVVLLGLVAVCGFYTGLYTGRGNTFGLRNEGARVRGIATEPASKPVENIHKEDVWNLAGKDYFGEMPHVDKCGLCFVCHKDQQAFAQNLTITSNATEVMEKLQAPSSWKIDPADAARFNTGSVEDRRDKPNCTECYGCTHSLQLPNEASTAMLNKSYALQVGASAEWVFVVKELGAEQPKSNIVKVWCVPIKKLYKGGFTACNAKAMIGIRNTFAIEKIVADCGFEDIVVKSWKAPVDGVIDGYGYHIAWDGMWYNLAKGASVETYLAKNSIAAGIEMLRKANSEQVVSIAVFDLLTSQCDRHAQNVFIDENGDLTLIDNDQALRDSIHQCGVNSLFLPTTKEYALRQVGFGYATKKPNSMPTKQPSVVTMLDYRCHAPGGKIGKNYPPKVKQCMESIASMTVDEIYERYDLMDIAQAEALQSRSKVMLEKGFEWALEFGPPFKPSDTSFQWYRPCCDFEVYENKGRCLDEAWHMDSRLPPF